MTSAGQARDLSQSGGNAILGLLRSIAPDIVPNDGKNLSGDDVRKINEKLIELLGEDAQNQDRKERGELVNEEGLPIVDITEPIEAADSRTTGALAAEEATIIPLVSLSEMERDRLRQERDRILDLLEEEEEDEEQRERDQFMEKRKELIRKKMEEAAKETNRTQAAKELQKKMAKGLIASIDGGVQENSNPPHTVPPKVKKSVTFAPELAATKTAEESHTGDVFPATLRKSNRPTLLGAVDGGHQPMRMNVVERMPVGRRLAQSLQPNRIDSDDESNSDEEKEREDDAPFAEEPPGDSASESDATDQSLEDLDYAQHQREIAIEYYAKRGIIGQAAAQAMMSHSHVEDEEEREIPVNIGVTEPQSKPSISRFKASKLASSYNASLPPETKSLDGSLLSASSAKALQRSIRMGKLDSRGRLTGHSEDSESEPENEAAQEVLDLLKKGEVYNVGPDSNQVLHPVPASPPKKEEQQVSAALPPLNKPKASKFKVDRSQAGPSKASQHQAKSISTNSPISTNLTSPAVVTERRPPGITSTNSTNTIPSITPAVVDSPSFPRASAQDRNTRISRTPPSTQQPMVVDSPSFQPPSTLSPFSMIIDSPSFPAPKGTPKTKTSMQPPPSFTPPSHLDTPMPANQARRPTRPPAVMSTAVREKASQPVVEHDVQMEAPRPKKVSRFLAERM
ncbi:hypothetical protein JOM56_003317 [Amanita muscaria]